VASAPTTAPGGSPDGPETTVTDPTTTAKLTSATAAAAKAGKPITVDGLTSQTSITTANPDGTFTTTMSTAPARILRGGSWVPVDTTLKVQGDGTVSPAAVPGIVALSGGGTAPLASQTHADATFVVSWPGTLPKPRLDGDTATYSEVLPGVDLKVTATPTGIRQQLVVKNKAAAANPALAALDFPVAVTGGAVATDADGSLTVSDAAGKPVFHGSAPAMWDSSGNPVEAAAAPDEAPSSARKAPMRLRAAAPKAASTKVTLLPDMNLLSNPAAAFPIILDPDTSIQTLNHYDTVWDVAASSNYLDNGSSLRSGHVWDANNSRYQTNRSFMNFAGLSQVAGKNITAATVVLTDSYSSSCTASPVELWATDGIDTSTTWNHQPNWAYRMDTKTFAHGYNNSSCPGAQESMTALQQVTTAAANGWDNITMGLRASNESDAAAWKIFESIKQGQTPNLVITWRSNAVAPTLKYVAFGGTQVSCGGWFGKISDIAASPLLVNADIFGDGQGNWGSQDSMQVSVKVTDNHGNQYVSPGTTVMTKGLNPPVAQNWTSPDLASGRGWMRADGSTITVQVSSTNLINQTAWSNSCNWTNDAISPGVPTLTSWDYPRDDWGPDLAHGGGFHLKPGNPAGNQTCYHIVADGQDGVPGMTWDQCPSTAWGAETGFAFNCPGCSFNPFKTSGMHRLTAQGISQAGNQSSGNRSTITAPYYFFLSPNAIQVDTATNLSPGTVNSTGKTVSTSQVITDADTGTQYTHAMLWGAENGAQLTFLDKVGGPDGSKVPPGSGYFAVEGTMTKSYDYGQVKLSIIPVLDASGHTPTDVTPQNLVRTFDAYRSGCCSATAFDFGGANLTQGYTYKIVFTASGANQAATSPFYNMAVDEIRLIPLHYTYDNLAASFNNVGITTDDNVAAGPQALDSDASTFDAASLAAAGYGRNATVTVAGVPYTLPDKDPNTVDNTVAQGQTIKLGNAKGSAVGLLLASTMGASPTITGKITYSGICNNADHQDYTLAPVPDWGEPAAAAGNTAAVSGLRGYRNGAGRGNRLYTLTIPVACPNVPLASIDLPAVSPAVLTRTESLHVFSIGVRPSTQGLPWVSSWATSLDTTATAGGGTVRMPVHATLGGTTARVRLDNPYATAPVTINAASIAVQSSGAAATANPVPLKFGGQASVTIPAGGQVYTDTAVLTVNPGVTLLVSLNLPTSGSYGAHAKTPATVWTASGDATGATAATGFAAGASGWVLVDDVEVTPSVSSFQMGTIAVLGDQIANGDALVADGRRLSDYLADNLADAAGVANLSITGNRLLADRDPGAGALSALNRLDRDVCSLPNLSTVLIEVGDNDLSAGAKDADLSGPGGLVALVNAVKKCGATPVVVPVTPFNGSSTWNAAGEPGYWNNLRSWSTTSNLAQALVADGGAASVLSAGGDATKLNPAYAAADQINLNDAGTKKLADTVATTAKWASTPDGISDRFQLAGDANDSVDFTYNGVADNVAYVANDRGSLTAAHFNGANSSVTIPDPGGFSTSGPVEVTNSYTVSAWVKLTNGANTGGSQTIIAQNGANERGFILGYDDGTKTWKFDVQKTDGATYTPVSVKSAPLNGTQYSGWTHLAGVYDASVHKVYLYVNGTLAGSTDATAGDSFTGSMVIGGRAMWQTTPTDYLNGDISDVVLYTGKALDITSVQHLYLATVQAGAAPPITALPGAAGQWKLNDGSGTAAADSGSGTRPATLSQGATWAADGAVNLDSNNTGVLTTAGPVVDTAGSYSVSAWVKLTDTKYWHQIMSQDGINASGFNLLYDSSLGSWAFYMANADMANPNSYPGATSSIKPSIGVWTHLTGTYDKTTGKVGIYVNGKLAGTGVNTTPWSATGPLRIGAAKSAGSVGGYFPGEIADARAYSQALSDNQIAWLAQNTGFTPAAMRGPIYNSMLNAKCVDDYAGSQANGAGVVSWDCGGNNGHQDWTMTANNTVALTTANSPKCLDITGGPGATGNGTLVQLWDCNGWANQTWVAQSDANGRVHLVNPNSGRCLDDPSSSMTNGTQLQIWDCNNSSAQSWTTPAAANLVTAGVTAWASTSTTGWEPKYVVDGVFRGTSTVPGYASAMDASANTDEWFEIDLLAVHKVNQVDLFPRNEAANVVGVCFPVDFTIQVSTDGNTWTTVTAKSGYAKPGDAPQSFRFNQVNARYIKVDATSLGIDQNNNHYLEMRQIAAYGV